MLKTIDVLIGVAMVMLLASMIVMTVTHFMMVLAGARGKNLRTGLSEFLVQLGPSGFFKNDEVKRVVSAILCHPQLKSPTGRIGTVVHREEFITLLLQAAAGTGPVTLKSEDRNKLKDFLAMQGVADPQKVLDNIHEMALQIERMNPELTADARRNLAVLQAGTSKLVSGVHAWFDRTIDRVSERYTYYSRLVTYAVAVLVAFTLQIDVIALVNRLSTDDAARSAIVARAIEEQHKYEQKLNSGPVTSSGGSSSSPSPTSGNPGGQNETTTNHAPAAGAASAGNSNNPSAAGGN